MRFCKDCSFFSSSNSKMGQCKRFPPVSIQEERKDNYGNPYTEIYAQQPWVNSDTDWCGEFKNENR